MDFFDEIRAFTLCNPCRGLANGNVGAALDLVKKSLRETGGIPQGQQMALAMVMRLVKNDGCSGCARKWSEIMD
ncbi:MAG: hypothetical protein FWB91_00485 [Defluviitaleaceae bacterium]|nr:hypothetical protein [Defluviitaleaceae bacterium]